MSKIVQYRHFNFILHALAWSIVLFVPYLLSIGPLPPSFFPLAGVVHIIIFYTNICLLYPKFLNKTYWWLYIPSVILLIICSVGIKSYMLASWFPNASPDARSHILFPSVLVFVVSIFYSVTLDKIRAEKLQKENEALQLGMELKFLRSQISPHFLFNILTNLVSLARKRSDQLETSLVMLSGLMRYMLYNADKKISLQQEVEYLESYISLQKLRFGREVNITFNVEVSKGNHYIEPMLLVPFVENAFKHGTGVDAPFIDVHLFTREGTLHFQVKNKFDDDASKDESSGIGLSNVRSRLALLYPGRHKLVISTDKNLFDINLTLKLW